ncbi:transmembrane protein 256 homolog [Linepithema humile]|uniref:transmembrane protein 256 homolog n=1 Tax=Linepithema humile TaxID=83485 RepID=UPI0006236612|nr:PREDICTED: transmembrane protein 256 homolog [Linepithema humile]XP_012235134.1 PREDICTED: transmembrane protein 256 homolog [Linepithema humile]
MSLQDVAYTVVTAPFNVIHRTTAGAASYTWKAATSATSYLGLQPKTEVKMVPVSVPLWKLAASTGPYIKLAALSGASAVILGAIGSHRHYSQDDVGVEQRRIFETANRYHFIHTLALLGLPMCRYPSVAAALMLSGIVLFCGSCYYTAFTGDSRFGRQTPIGGFCFILAWCSMLL